MFGILANFFFLLLFVFYAFCRRQYRRDQRRTGYVGQQQKSVIFAAGRSDTAYPTPFDVRPSSVILPGPTRERLRDVRPSAVHGGQVGEKFAVFRFSTVQRPGEILSKIWNYNYRRLNIILMDPPFPDTSL